MSHRRKHQSDAIVRNKPFQSRKYKSEILSSNQMPTISIKIAIRHLLDQIIDKTIHDFQTISHITKHLDHVQLITHFLQHSNSENPSFLQKPTKLINQEFKRQQKPKVHHHTRIPSLYTTIKDDRDKHDLLNQKQVMNKLKREYLSKSKIGKQNMEPFKLDSHEENQNNQLSYERSTLRGIKKYTEKNLKIIDLAKHEAMIEGKGSRDDEYVLDSDAKLLKLRKDALNSLTKPKLSKRAIVKADISFTKQTFEENKPEQLKIKRKGNTFHFEQNQKNESRPLFQYNTNLPGVEQLQSSLQMHTNLSKNVKIRETQHKLLTRLSKFNNYSAHVSQSEIKTFSHEKLPFIQKGR